MNSKPTKADIALIGLAVMGENLALNMERNGYTVAIANRTKSKTENFLATKGASKNFIGCDNYSHLVSTLKSPRIIFMMVKAGQAVDELITELTPHLDAGDILIDGGNSFYLDTERRVKELSTQNINFIGCGVSGGEKGALLGPSIMPGGNISGWEAIKPILQKIAAKAEDGTPCCNWMGNGGAGHFVKMVHNGIEYGDMQLISECYAILHHVGKFTLSEISEFFHNWNQGATGSYLLEITANILKFTDSKTNTPLLDMIRDNAGQKGTGNWTVKAALELGVEIPTITEALFARTLSSDVSGRQESSAIYPYQDIEYSGDKTLLVKSVQAAGYASKICSYAQGFRLLQAASVEYNWDLNLSIIAGTWRNGCIIRAGFLNDITEAFRKNSSLSNLLLDDFFSKAMSQSESGWRLSVSSGITHSIPCPALSASLSWFDAIRSKRLPTNLIQAQRDYFGAHTYERVDSPRGEYFHTEWEK